jgi:nucleoside-diphosphate-sugar epimerase
MGELKVLVLGDGLLGGEIVKQTGWDYISRKKSGFDINGDLEEMIDLSTPYTVILNCIANTNTYSDDKTSHWDINYKFVDKLIKFCNTHDKKLVHISTDYIYAGSDAIADEEKTVPVHCNNWYGYTKLLGDGLVQLQSVNHLIIRCTHKPNPFPYEAAWVDQVGNFDYVDVISGKIIELINGDASGVFNVGTTFKSIYELAKETKSNVKRILSPPEAPKNQTMNIDKMIMFLINNLKNGR